MNIGKFAAAAIIAVTGVLATVSGALAFDAVATTALNVRTGPGTNYPVIAALSRNQVVQVGQCNSSNTWCQVTAANIRGWSSARYLRRIGPTTPQRPTPDNDRPDVGFSVEGPNFSFSFGTGRPGGDGRVCFYEGFNYSGRSFCATDDDSDRRLTNFWNDRIRSIRLEGDISATVCSGTNFSGRCGVVARSVRNLGSLSDNISSFYLDRR